MDDAFRREFVARYRRLDRIGRWALHLPENLRARLAGRLASMHPYALWSRRYVEACRAGLGIDENEARRVSARFLQRQLIAFWRSLRYGALDAAAVRRLVDPIDLPADWRPEDGGLVLTYHVPDWHLLCCALGATGGTVWPVAIGEEQTAFRAELGGYLRRLNEGCERHFRGGRFLFVREGADTFEAVDAKLAERGLVVALIDLLRADDDGSRAAASLLGRRFVPRAGVVKAAIARGVPVLAAGIAFDAARGRYRMFVRRIASRDVAQAVEAYFGELERWIREVPDVWDGWHWYLELAES